VSHVAIAAALALEDMSCGERLAAFSLASFANREHRAWPGTRVAAARAGLSRSQYLAARDGLQKRGLVVVEELGGGRGHSPVVTLLFAQSGPWLEGEINAALLEAVLGYSRARGSARLLLATLAAVANEQLEVSGLATDEIRAAAGMADSTYRRARAALLAGGELVLVTAGGGRARTNRWVLRDPGETGAKPALARRTRPEPSRTARPLIATVKEPSAVRARDDTAAHAGRNVVKGPGLTGVSEPNPGQIRTVYTEKGPGLSGVPEQNPGQGRTVGGGKGPGLSGVCARNPAQDRTVSRKTPPQTPPETPPPNACAGREPKNPRTGPPSPPDGGSRAGSITIVEDYVTDRGRKRPRTVVVDVDEIRSQFRQPDDADQTAWRRIRCELRRVVGDSAFEIWLDQLELRATDQTGSLLLAGPPATQAWVAKRFGRLLAHVASSLGRQLRLVEDRELQLLDAISHASIAGGTSPLFPTQTSHHQKEAV